MSTVVPDTNQLIDRLPAAGARSLLAACHPVDLEFDQMLAEADAPVTRVLFPTTAIISVTAQVKGYNPLEMGMIGYEGMLGATLALGIDRHPMQAVVQGSGGALEVSASRFRDLLKNDPELICIVDSYLFVLGEQLALTAACNAFHEVAQRLARWLLMMDDRARGEPLVLTHLFLYQVLSRPGLESVACECYPAALAAYERQFGPNGR